MRSLNHDVLKIRICWHASREGVADFLHPTVDGMIGKLWGYDCRQALAASVTTGSLFTADPNSKLTFYRN
jgi:hypothetical protein